MSAKCCNHTFSMDAAINYFSHLLQSKFSVAELLQTLPVCTCREPPHQGVKWTCLG